MLSSHNMENLWAAYPLLPLSMHRAKSRKVSIPEIVADLREKAYGKKGYW